METLRKPVSLKALAQRVLTGNPVGNFKKTGAESRGNFSPSERPNKFPITDSDSVAYSSHRDWNSLPDGSPSGARVGTFNEEAMGIIQAGGKVPVWSDVLGEWLWWVRDEEAREQLLSEGCKVVIYTLGELALVAGWDEKSLEDVHAIKKTFGGKIESPQG